MTINELLPVLRLIRGLTPNTALRIAGLLALFIAIILTITQALSNGEPSILVLLLGGGGLLATVIGFFGPSDGQFDRPENPGPPPQGESVLEESSVPWDTPQFGKMDDHYWCDFFCPAFQCVKDNQRLQVDMAGHSLWAHYAPEGCDDSAHIDQREYLSKIEQLEFSGELWKQGLRAWVQRGKPVNFRLLLIEPGSLLSELIQSHQERQPVEKERQRKARTDGYATLYVVWKLKRAFSQLGSVVFILDAETYTMTYSFCKIGTHITIGHYNYEGRSYGQPCTKLFSPQEPGQHFCHAFEKYFRGEASAIPIRLEKNLGLQDGTAVETYPEFCKWVDEEIERGRP